MSKTLAQLEKQIDSLRKQAEALRSREAVEVIAKIKSAISAYGFTSKDLFETGGNSGVKARSNTSGTKSAPKYRDAAGQVWGGRGPRPQWLRDALASGKQLSDFVNDEADQERPLQGGASTRRSATKKAVSQRLGAKKSATKKTATARYTDGTNMWPGRGPRPGWLIDALAAGKTLEELRMQ